MEYISSFTYCDKIQAEMTPQGPRYQIMNPLQVLAPVAIPGNYSFSVACSIVGFEATKENTVRITFLSPTGDERYNSGDVKFQIPEEQNINVIQFNVDIRNLVLKETGLYSTKVIFNDRELGEYKIQVLVGEC